MLNLDMVFHVEKPNAIIDASSTEDKTHNKDWERSNIIGLMFMRMSITSNIKLALSKTENAREFMKLVEERCQIAGKSLAGTLMTLITMKFDGSCTMDKHVFEITNIVARSKSLGMTVDENFLI